MSIVHDVEQGSDAWRKLRAGVPSASCFDKIITSTGAESKQRAGYAKTLAAELYSGSPLDDAWTGNKWTERGKELEDEAVRWYEFDQDVKTERVGFVMTDDGSAGCSPDRLIGEHALLEIKCLKSENHVDTILYFRRHGTPPTDYIQQTQGQLYVTGRQVSHLLFYSPQLPSLVIKQGPLLQVIGGLIIGIKRLIEERDEIVKVLREYGA